MYAQVAIKPNPLLRNGAYGIVMRGVQKCTRGCSSLRGRNKLPLCCIKLDTATDFACGTGGFLVSWLKELKKQVHTTEDEEAYSNSILGIEKKPFPYMLCVTNLLLHGLDVPQVFHANTLLHDVLDYTEGDKVDVILMNPPYGGSEKADVKNHFPADLASSETRRPFYVG